MTARADRRRRRLVLAAVLIAWWALLGGLWMLLVDTVSTAEVLSAVAVALVAALATRLVFGSGTDSMRPAASLPAALVRQLARVPADLGLLGIALGVDWRSEIVPNFGCCCQRGGGTRHAWMEGLARARGADGSHRSRLVGDGAAGARVHRGTRGERR